MAASQTLRAALTKAEQAHPGLSYDIVVGILKKGDLNVNMNESILRLQGGASETDCESPILKYRLNKLDLLIIFVFLFLVIEYRLNRTEDAFQELNKKSASLKRILSRIPDEISDRKTFLETIKYVFFIFFNKATST